MQLKASVIFFVVFFLPICSLGDVAMIIKSASNYVVEDSSHYQERKKIFEDCVNSIDKDDSAAINIARIFREFFYIAEPINSVDGDTLGVRVLEGAGGLKTIAAVPILPGDEEAGVEWEFEIMSHRGVSFIPDFPMLVIIDNGISDFWKGLVMVRKGSHIASFISGAFESITDPLENRVVNEYCAYSLVFGILNKKGGKKYKEILSEKVDLIKAQFLKDGTYLSLDLTEADKLNNAFAEAPMSEDEIFLRWENLWLHSTFVAIEELNKEDRDKKRAKINYLVSILRGKS